MSTRCAALRSTMRAVLRRVSLAGHPVAQRLVLVLIGVLVLLAVGAATAPLLPAADPAPAATAPAP